MLETYPWHIVYGFYGSLLEAHLCDIGIHLRHILWHMVSYILEVHCGMRFGDLGICFEVQLGEVMVH
jgi:hypothetical protein